MNVLDLIKKYPRIFPPRENGKVNTNYTSVPKGWLLVLDHMLGAIQHHVDTYTHVTETESKPVEQVVCIQMKEKFGDLRFYYTGGNAYIAGMVQLATHICSRICSVCSSDCDLGMTVDYIATVCNDCFNNGSTPGETWKPMEEINNLNYAGQTDGTQPS